MNEKLKFSWGHIFAFLAMIAITYITYTGAAYLYKTNLIIATIWAVGTFVVLFVVFIGMQQMKAVEEHFKRCILLERLCAICSIAILGAMITISPFKHFWTVYGNRTEITSEFASAIDSSKNIFDNYDAYVNTRIEKVLKDSLLESESCAELLHMQLIPVDEEIGFNYQTKKDEIISWIDVAKESSVWNVFMLGNLAEIEKSVESWKGVLETWSAKKFYPGDAEPYYANYDIKAAFDHLKTKYTKTELFQWRALLWALVGYFFLILPWLLQRRPVKNPNLLFGKKKWTQEDDYEAHISQQEIVVERGEDDDTFEI